MLLGPIIESIHGSVSRRPAGPPAPLPSHRCHEVFRSRAPAGDGADGLGKGDVEDVHAFAAEDVHGPGKRSGHRRDEDRESAVVELFDDERRDERVLDFDQCRLPGVLLTVSRQSLCQAAQQAVPRKPLEEQHSPCAREAARPARVRTATPTRKQSAKQQEQGQEALSREPVRDHRCEWPHQGRDRLHALEQQQYRQVERALRRTGPRRPCS